MSAGIIIHLDDDAEPKGVLDRSKNYFDQLETGLSYICCSNTEEFIEIVEQKHGEVKALIFDLVGKKEDGVNLKTQSTDFTKQLQEKYSWLRVPIFIFSAHLEEYEDFAYAGTVFKFDKGEGAFEGIAEKIKLFNETGFLDLFCFNGEIEKLLFSELHNSFVKQFACNQNGSDIEGIIHSVKEANGDVPKRTKEIFTRIALRSLLANLMIDKSVEAGDEFNESKINAVEHYLRRINRDNVPVWTGDIFLDKKNETKIIVLAPRCDIATKGKENLLVCGIVPSNDIKKGDIEKFMKDNILSKKIRFLPKTSVFDGGKVDLSEHTIVKKEALINVEEYDYLISLSDELTNEILGKFCAYLLRTSLPEVDPDELKAFLNNNETYQLD
jgi:hypothetical protein